MTLQDYIDQVRRLLDEHDTDISFWEDDELIDWINEAQHEVAKISKHLADRAYIDPVEEDMYKLPDDYIDWYKIRVNGDNIKSIPMDDEGDKKGFFIWGNHIYLSKVETGSKLVLYYYRAPIEMKFPSDDPDIPKQYQRIIIPFVLYRAFTKDAKPDMASIHQQEFMERVSIMKRNFAKKPNRRSWIVRRQ